MAQSKSPDFSSCDACSGSVFGDFGKNRAAAASPRRSEVYPLSIRSPEQIRAAIEAAKKEAREELGEAMQLVEMGSEVTIERLFEELSVIERLDGMIDRYIKRLLLVRGVKSMSLSSSIAPAPSRKRRVA